jgi:hypothetical protein
MVKLYCKRIDQGLRKGFIRSNLSSTNNSVLLNKTLHSSDFFHL